MIRIYSVVKRYQKHSAALNDISLRITKGEFVYITGPSGAGKSTLLKLLFCAERPSRGQILINGQNVTRMRLSQIPYLRRKLGVVFQDFKLLNNRTVLENVSFPLEIQGKKRYEISKRVYQTLKLVGLEKHLQKHPLELSGGEQQRVAIARALIMDPLILMADEPTGNLDAKVTEEIMELFKGANARGTTVIMATHNQEVIRRYPRRVIMLREGRVEEDVTP
jgi:cell division transport system ATP-binding protein